MKKKLPNRNRRCFLVLLGVVFGVAASCGFAVADRPNILFAISDDQSFAHNSISGCKCIQTPNFDRIAREGVLFRNSITASPGCTPSRSSILTGRYPWQLEQAGTHASSFPKKFAVYPDVLEAHGYFVGYTGKGWGPGNFAVDGWKRNPAGPAFSDLKFKKAPAKGIAKTDYAANFEAFIKAKPTDQPFCFWYGGHEPHRGFKKGSGVAAGKKLADVDVPDFLPDSPEIRNDILDYCLEIEWFDQQLGKMLKLLEETGQLENTLVVVTSDNGMAFPRAKANVYEFGIHMPLAIRWAKQVSGGRVVDDLVSHTDFAPTFLDAAKATHPSEGVASEVAGQTESEKTPPMTGQSLLPLLVSNESGETSFARDEVYSCRERHSSSRWNNLTYPQRCVRTSKYLLIQNFAPERWPAGAPRKFEKDQQLGPEHGGYHDIDGSPSLAFLVENRNDPAISHFFDLAVRHRPPIELFDIQSDPGCVTNLVDHPDYVSQRSELANKLTEFLRSTEDPRLIGNGETWESYKRYSRLRSFPKPDWAK